MKIRHRVTFGKMDAVDAEIEALNIKYKKTPMLHGYYLITFEIDESDPRWPQIAELIQQKGAPDLFNTIFTEKEILSAEWVRLIPTFEHGYPQPEESWSTNPMNYENHCSQCGAFRQKASFRLKKEPTPGKNEFMTLHWGYAVFCTPGVLKELEAHQIRGYEVWDAIIHKSNTPSRKVSQLFVPHVAEPGLVSVNDLKREECSECGITRYHPHMRGMMYLKREALPPDLDIVQTHEWFGDGHSAHREILVSGRLARLILEKGWRGLQLKAIELV